MREEGRGSILLRQLQCMLHAAYHAAAASGLLAASEASAARAQPRARPGSILLITGWSCLSVSPDPAYRGKYACAPHGDERLQPAGNISCEC